jgi:hypothetical protein
MRPVVTTSATEDDMEKKTLRTMLAAFAFATLGLAAGCTSEITGSHVNALTGAVCTPDRTYIPREAGGARGGNDKCQGTGPGDNCDDLSSGKIDCIGDGNSGQGDDKKHNCEFPQPGCDENGCCDDDIVEPPPPPPPPEEPPPPPEEPPPVEEPPPPPEEPPPPPPEDPPVIG